MSFRLDGLDKFKAFLKDAPLTASRALEAAMIQTAETVRTVSMQRVPVDLGTLKSSAHVSGPDRGVVTIGYGGAASAYALAVHEGAGPPSWSGGVTFNVGGPKYLEGPFNELAAPTLTDLIRNLEKQL